MSGHRGGDAPADGRTRQAPQTSIRRPASFEMDDVVLIMPPVMSSPKPASKGLTAQAVEQLACLLPAFAAADPARYRTLANYSSFCDTQHLTALPIDPNVVGSYLSKVVLRADVSPWTAHIVLQQLCEAAQEMLGVLSEARAWTVETFKGMLEAHEAVWKQAEQQRHVVLAEEAEHEADQAIEYEEQAGADQPKRVLRTRRAKKVSSSDGEESDSRLGMKRTRSNNSAQPAKRQRMSESPVSDIPVSDDGRTASQHPATRSKRHRRDSTDSLSSLPVRSSFSTYSSSLRQSQPTSPLPRSSPPRQLLKVADGNESDASSIVEYQRKSTPIVLIEQPPKSDYIPLGVDSEDERPKAKRQTRASSRAASRETTPQPQPPTQPRSSPRPRFSKDPVGSFLASQKRMSSPRGSPLRPLPTDDFVGFGSDEEDEEEEDLVITGKSTSTSLLIP